jgi:hypothetical protein
MGKEFAPYKESFELKQLGFDYDCFSYFRYDGTQGPIGLYYSYDQPKDLYVLQPTFSQALRWLLEEHNLYGIIIPTVTMAWTFKTMTVVIGMVDVPPYINVDVYDYIRREEAELASLKKLIDIVKKK